MHNPVLAPTYLCHCIPNHGHEEHPDVLSDYHDLYDADPFGANDLVHTHVPLFHLAKQHVNRGLLDMERHYLTSTAHWVPRWRFDRLMKG